MEIYCIQMGSIIEFSYCMSQDNGLPCRNIVGCWQDRFDIQRFLKSKFTEEEMIKVFGGLPKNKLERIIECLSRHSGRIK
ncbi:MAG TPA: hypothetical protein PK864_00030 [Syntrophorhabdaceae bacterium]|nr:hypothetical protein [Syntrophorhabdaceae bacterium]HOL04857.1 hypothetical protein [Syntrophorhabdaceae bacterium]HON84401.1 hypothetical protein [Syntrophorhabdaceae bacterium]HOT41140.1 hypothetical protein [Syntrophorhabdaceae bacterium]HPC65797.1 hypothetical protein [Syntrophorhabdaceae bacterium]